ncbi:hypothetical protein ACS3SW_19545 [Roseobacteraceae bacterium S113]
MISTMMQRMSMAVALMALAACATPTTTANPPTGMDRIPLHGPYQTIKRQNRVATPVATPRAHHGAGKYGAHAHHHRVVAPKKVAAKAAPSRAATPRVITPRATAPSSAAGLSQAAQRAFGYGLRSDDRIVTVGGKSMALRQVKSSGHSFAILRQRGVPISAADLRDRSAEAETAAGQVTGCQPSGNTWRRSDGANNPSYAVHILC